MHTRDGLFIRGIWLLDLGRAEMREENALGFDSFRFFVPDSFRFRGFLLFGAILWSYYHAFEYSRKAGRGTVISVKSSHDFVPWLYETTRINSAFSEYPSHQWIDLPSSSNRILSARPQSRQTKKGLLPSRQSVSSSNHRLIIYSLINILFFEARQSILEGPWRNFISSFSL